MTAENPIAELLAAPLGPDWTIEQLAEQLLDSVVAQPDEEVDGFILDVETIKDRQSQRILRPLLAHLATKSAGESGTTLNLYGGQLSFKRLGPAGPVWIVGQFDNQAGAVRLFLRRYPSDPGAEASTQTPTTLRSGQLGTQATETTARDG